MDSESEIKGIVDAIDNMANEWLIQRALEEIHKKDVGYIQPEKTKKMIESALLNKKETIKFSEINDVWQKINNRYNYYDCNFSNEKIYSLDFLTIIYLLKLEENGNMNFDSSNYKLILKLQKTKNKKSLKNMNAFEILALALYIHKTNIEVDIDCKSIICLIKPDFIF